MIRSLMVAAAFGIAMAPLMPAMAQQAGSADTQAKFQQEAEKSCNYDLDHDHFDNYGTMDECISDKMAKLKHAYMTGSGTPQSKANAQSHQPN
jgi:hypothetical protein